MKGHANWSGRVPRTTEQAFGPGEYMKAEREANPDRPWHYAIAACLVFIAAIAMGWNPL